MSTPPSSDVTAFSWGYWGWGNATAELVRGVDAAEARAGFAPPLFVDVRFNRSVRAVGFNGNSFGALLGNKRYLWMRTLGNKQIGEREGPRMAIADPHAAFELLDRVTEAARAGQRTLFFCSCEHARDDHGVECHRTEVARLVRAAAAERGIALQTIEWPGGDTLKLTVSAPAMLLRAILRGRATLPLQGTFDLGEMAGLPWGSHVRARDGDLGVLFASGPARFTGGAWCLPVLKTFEDASGAESPHEAWSAELRKRRMLEPIPSGSPSGPLQLADACVYTIAHVDKLSEVAAGSGRGELKEGGPWTTAKTLLERARHEGQRLPIVFADAADCTRLLFWAVLTHMGTSATGTTYRFEGLKPLPGGHTPQDLTLEHSRRKIAPGFIRPYALCRTPQWLRGEAQLRQRG